MKINAISLTDFRAFPGPSAATFHLDGKNLLVYGENGSGKSSLFHALRGFFDYQRPPSLLTLQNSFSNSGIGAVKVEVVFDDLTSAAWSVVSGFPPNLSPWSVPPMGPVASDRHPGHDAPVSAEIRQAARFSACLDYRSLLNTNYKHDDREIIEAAANYVRQAFETGIRVACELKHIKLNYRRDSTEHKAQDLLNGLKGWPGTATVLKVDWDNAIHRLELFKDVVMNPYSHPSAPNIPRQEIIDSANAVEHFLDLVATR